MPKYTPNPDSQPELISEDQTTYQLTPEEEKENESFRQRLRAYLRDPEFRQIEGFPIGEDEDILALSDPPYYTACPNPFLGEIVTEWQRERTELRKDLTLPDDSQDNDDGLKVYHREPFASDVSEGKNNPIYNAHSYHTKVPHKAVMHYILHYTDPGDIILDGFCGTGMAGVAAQLCADKKTVESLNYMVQSDGSIKDNNGRQISLMGTRKAILIELSPAATFIAYNYNTPVDANEFEKESSRMLIEIEKEFSWMYETWHPNCNDQNRIKGRINYTIWSDVFICPNCGDEMIFWDVAVDKQNKKLQDIWNCPNCNIKLAKSPRKDSGAEKVERSWETKFDPFLGYSIKQIKQVPVIINYSFGKNRLDKTPDKSDIDTIQQIRERDIGYSFPTKQLRDGDISSNPKSLGISYSHHFFTPRNLSVIASLYYRINKISNQRLKHISTFSMTAAMRYLSKLSKLGITYYFSRGGGVINAGITGTLFVPSFSAENNVLRSLSIRIPKLIRVLRILKNSIGAVLISTQSSNDLSIKDETIDYVFIDPPFGSNIMYSDLNYFWESWLKVLTNFKPEAIINKTQQKGLIEYQDIIESCFKEFYRVIKSGRWITIEFHNSQNSIWNAIQEAILRAGFMIADVRTLDKKQGSFQQVTTTAAVKQDLIISAYKPRSNFERKFFAEGGSIQGAMAFTRQHLEQLPLPSVLNGVVGILAERQNYLLYDRMVAFHIMRGLVVPLSAAEFYQGLNQNFLERDSMYFTPAQATEYDKQRLGAQEVEQLSLFVTDEKTAIQWLRQELSPVTGSGPQTYQDLQPKFLRELYQARYEALPELREMLDDNFLQDEGGRWYVPNPEKQADLELMRHRMLLREFNEYLKSKGRLKVFRSEAIRAGFSHHWKDRDYDTIIEVADRLPSKVLEEDQQLLMYVHNAGLRQVEQPKQTSMI